MKKIFCFIGKTGAGKSTYLDEIMKLINKKKIDNIASLVYCTTRSKRSSESEGIDYYFYTEEEYNNLDKDDIIESRMYNTVRGPMYYFTTKKCLEKSDNFIAAVSIEQLANYIKRTSYIKNNKNPEFEIFMININCGLRTRFERVMKKRCDSDEDLLELCRRVLQEKQDYEVKEVVDIINLIPEDNKLTIDNESALLKEANSLAILDWINSKL